ncbi:MAG: hypothetical protein M0P69_01480 [Bacteroidales bacterium]|nr:hypothetical protein [Bacteroidales bacterium]
MANNEYDLTFKKFSELDAGSAAATTSDKFIMSDVSDDGKVVTRTINDIVNLVTESDPNITARTVYVNVTLAELKAGKTLLAAAADKDIVITDINVTCNGAFTTLTSADIQAAGDTPTEIFSMAQAQMTDGAILFKGETGVTLGAGFNARTSTAINIVNTGTDAEGGTSLDISISYLQVTPLT